MKFNEQELKQLRFRESLIAQKKLEIQALEQEKQMMVMSILMKKGLDIKKRWCYDLNKNKIWQDLRI